MKNIAKHSIKCNKRDKLELIRFRYEVRYDGNFVATFRTKFEAFEWLTCVPSPDSRWSVFKVSEERVLS